MFGVEGAIVKGALSRVGASAILYLVADRRGAVCTCGKCISKGLTEGNCVSKGVSESNCFSKGLTWGNCVCEKYRE